MWRAAAFLNFLDGNGQVAWTIDTGGYPHGVDAWKDTVFWAFLYPDEGTVYAYEAGGSAPSWTFDPNTLVSATPPLRPYFRVLGDALYVGAHEHVFELDPASGSVMRRWDLSALTGIPFEGAWDQPTFYAGGLDIGTLSADPDTLVVGFERRFVVIDRQSGAVLWHQDPDAFPYDPYPLVHGGLLVVTAGEAVAGPRPPARKPPFTALDGGGGCAISSPGHGSWWGLAALTGALLALRRIRLARAASVVAGGQRPSHP